MLSILATTCLGLAAMAPIGATGETLKFGMDINYPPYAYLNSTTGELAGFGADIARGINATCADIQIDLVQVLWSDCWSAAAGGTLGAKLENGTVDACMTYTHTQGIRNVYAEFSGGILNVNKAAGLIAPLDRHGMPLVTGQDTLLNKTVVDVGGWAPTADGLGFVENKCTGQPYSSNYTLLVGKDNDESLRMTLNGTADAMFVYSDQARNYQCKAGVDQTEWDCDLWAGFGKTFAYVQTGQFGYVVNGTTLALAKKGSGVADKVNPCLWSFMKSKEYHDICQKHGLTAQCYPNQYFTAKDYVTKEYNLPTETHTGDCSNGYCPCLVSRATTTTKKRTTTTTSALRGELSGTCGGKYLTAGAYTVALLFFILPHLTK